jgi:hypothetical protein
MNPDELKEVTERAHLKGEKEIGLTMAVVAVLLAVATLLSHRAHTEEIVLQTKAADQWNEYQGKDTRLRMYESFAKIAALLPDGKEVAAELRETAKKEQEGVPAKNGKPGKDGKDTVREKATEMDNETNSIARRASHYDMAELFLEVSIVLCSIALLADDKLYWKLSFISTILGMGVALWGFLLH